MKHTSNQHTKTRTFAGRCASILLSGSLIACHGAMAASQDREVNDNTVSLNVESEFIGDPGVPFNEIDVTTQDGIVTLKGKTDNLLAKERATLVAETVKGVRSVVNLVKVKPTKDLTGATLAKRVDSALFSDPAADSYEVDVTADDHGRVTLTGTVDSWQEMNLAGIVAKSVTGVTELRNDLEIDYKTNRPDFEIEAEVKKCMHWDTLVDDGLIKVSVDDSKVTLTGIVGSAAEKRRAGTNAWVSGVDSIDDSGLKVERWARDEDLRKNKYASRPDDEIRDAIKDAFLHDPRVLSFNVTPKVTAGWVTLRGTVDNAKAKQAAERVARHTVGVHGVSNHLKVRTGDPLSDDEIKSKVELKLTVDPYVEAYEVDADVNFGTVYLRGTVDSAFEKAQAGSVAYGVMGVTNVKNLLKVSDPYSTARHDPYLWSYDPHPWDYYPQYPQTTFRNGKTVKTDAAIREDIEDELFWSPFVDLDEVNVEVDGGTATLTGEVDSLGEYEAATENALEGGAHEVDNDLVIR